MKKTSLALLLTLATLQPVRTVADILPSPGILQPIITCSPEGGGLETLMLTHEFTPLMTHREFMNLRGNVSRIITYREARESGFAYADKASDTISLSPDGWITRIAHHYYDYDGSPMPTTVFTLKSEGRQLLSVSMEEASHTANGLRWSRKTKDITYDGQNRPTLLVTNFYTGPSLTQLKREEWAQDTLRYTYNANGTLASATGEIVSNGLVRFNAAGRVTQLSLPDSRPTTFTYDPQGRLSGYKNYIIDGMDDVFYSETVHTYAYNEHGDVSKITETSYATNARWVRNGRRYYHYIYTITYQYDPQGNWTKATVKMSQNGGPGKVTNIFTRTISYANP